MTDNDFYNSITFWLEHKGYSIIYSNHPNISPREWHFIKDGIRVVCINDPNDPYFYLYCDLFLGDVDEIHYDINYALRTGKYQIEDKGLDEIHANMLCKVKLLKSRWAKLYYFFT